MKVIKDLLAKGQLNSAIEALQQAIRHNPAQVELRAALVELLCLAGDLERADDALAVLVKRNPDWIPGALNLRQLIRAQQARLALREGRLADGVKAEPSPALEALLALNLHLHQGELDQAAEAAEALEQARQPVHFQAGDAKGEIRDCDDSLGPFVEGLGTDGHYYLWQWHQIRLLELHAPASPVEMIWRRATVTLADERQGEVFLPLVYVANQNEDQQLGRETDWQEHGPALVTGLGQKLLLLGDEALPLGSLRSLERLEEAAHAG
ncbi:type VI secretion system accessory protein TagJ [Gallaecimonas kandeliae]|uniref:type VI secretion system accessory protein TagJ n=1 Tax=Gallaecimonas kandeliae TaxID=3029055 RepID=UPI0026480BC7|nr:type VI secretion system accessory protein TagJ [Gallaecimonas kandeliae]WKE65738.1 type VI secretion system accessory protein TagJ [Gallaecimonas kandeliae]